MAQGFAKKFREKYGADPDSEAACGYDSALVLADAIKRAGTTDGPKLRDALAATKDFQGVTGNITIDKERNARKNQFRLPSDAGATGTGRLRGS